MGVDPDREEVLFDALAAVADPDQALARLARLTEALSAGPAGRNGPSELLGDLRHQDGLRERLLAVLGASAALADHLLRHPEDWRTLADDAAAASRPSALGLQ